MSDPAFPEEYEPQFGIFKMVKDESQLWCCNAERAFQKTPIAKLNRVIQHTALAMQNGHEVEGRLDSYAKRQRLQ